MNVAFLANSFHLAKTRSTDFLIELLREWFGSVQVIPHKDAWARLPGTKWDLIVVFQKMWRPTELEAFGASQIVLVPMYDDCPKERIAWESYRGFRILSFSATLGRDLAAWGHDVMTVQYWQVVPEVRVTDFSSLRGFFWPRTSGLSWRQIQVLASASTWQSFHLHITNPEGGAELPSVDARITFKIEQSAWFDSNEAAREAVSRANVYFAPRRYEGIGQAVLEALALGLCVVAPNTPTMNEYILHGENGLLFDPDDPIALDLSRAEDLGKAARAVATFGRANWEASTPTIRAFLVKPSVVQRNKRHPWVEIAGRSIAFLRAIYRSLHRGV